MFYIVDKAGKVITAGTKKEVTAKFGALSEKERLETTVLVREVSDLGSLTLTAMTDLFNSLVAEEDQVKKLLDKTTGAERTYAAMEYSYDPRIKAREDKETAKAERAAAKEAKAAPAPEAKGKSKAAPANGNAPREGSKMGNLVVALSKGKPLSLDQLSAASGYDEQNTRTAIGILRSKKGMDIAYDREAKVYSLG